MRIVGSDHFCVVPRAKIQIGPPRKEAEGTERLLALRPAELAYKIGYKKVNRLFKLDKYEEK